MSFDRSRLTYLLQRYADNTCTFDEFNECVDCLREAASDPLVLQWMEDQWRLMSADKTPVADWQRLYPLQAASVGGPADIGAATHSGQRRLTPWLAWSAAAALLLCIAGYFLLHRNNKDGQLAGGPAKQDIAAPSGARAILQLAGGTSITLDSVGNGTISRQGGASVSKQGPGQLVYHAEDTAAGKEQPLVYNTLITARGGQTSIVLADGTRVWLNALSSLRFPTAFTGKERRVELKGEAYFEVAANSTAPFRVYADKMQVQVLGTSFDINAYQDEPKQLATLLEGKISVNTGKEDFLLRPGQQGALDQQGRISLVRDPDLDAALAWKNGRFTFEDADIHSVMRQIARWYDVDVEYEGKAPEERFEGDISRSSNLSEVLKILELSNIHCRIQGKKLSILAR